MKLYEKLIQEFPSDDYPEFVTKFKYEDCNNEKLIGITEMFDVAYTFQGHLWTEIKNMDFFIIHSQDDIITPYVSLFTIYLTDTAWIYYLPGILWACISDYNNIDILDVHYDNIISKLDINDFSDIYKANFEDVYSKLTLPQRKLIAECLYELSIKDMERTGGIEFNSSLQALKKYWLEYLDQ